MTNEAERTPMTNSEAEFAKQHRSKKISRYSDESKNPCVKVTALFLYDCVHSSQVKSSQCC